MNTVPTPDSLPQHPATRRWSCRSIDVHTVVAIIPFVVIVLFYSCVLHGRLWIGRWPEPNQPDPESIPNALFQIHHALTMCSVVMLGGAPLLWLSLLPFADRDMSLRAYLLRLVLFIIGLGTAILLGLHDPGAFLDWLMD